MDAFKPVMEWIISFLNGENFRAITVWSAILCSLADIGFTMGFLAVANLARRREGKRLIVLRMWALVLFLVATPFLLAPMDQRLFIVVQMAILAPPYVILAMGAIFESKRIILYLKYRMDSECNRSVDI